MRKIDNIELFEKTPVPRAIMTMAIPAVFSQLIILIYNMADTFFIGRANNPYMVAGASLILPIFNVCISLACLAGTGGSTLISQLLGEGRPQEARKVCSFSIYISILLAAAFSVLTFFCMGPLMDLLGATEETYEYASSYAFCVIVLGAVPTILTNVFSNLVRSVGESGKAGAGVMLGGLINIALDPLFMFVILEPGNEIMGAGLATFFSNCISCAYFLFVMWRMRKKSVLGLSSIRVLPSRDSIRRIMALGLPSMLTVLLFDLDYLIIDKLIAGYNDIALAAIGIVLKIERLPINIGIGINQGMMPIIAYNFSSKNIRRMRNASRFSMWLGIATGIVSISLYELFAPSLVQFFIADAQTVALGTDFLRIRCLASIFMFLSFYHVNLFNCYGRGREALFLGVMRWGLINIPMLYILNGFVGMYGIIWSQLISDVIVVTVSVLFHRRFMKTHTKLFTQASPKDTVPEAEMPQGEESGGSLP